MTTLLMSSRHTEDDQALWRAAIGRGWSIARARGIRLPEIEDADGAWGSGIYGCEPDAVLDVMRHATVQRQVEGNL